MMTTAKGFRQRSESRIILFTKLSVLLNAVIALGKIGMGIYSLSIFLCINGVYSIGIGLAKAAAIKGYNDSLKASDAKHPNGYQREEYRCYYLVGIIITVTSLVYMIYCTKMLIGKDASTQYTTFIVMVIGSFTAIEIAASVQGIISTRRGRKPIMEAIKMTSFVSALISLVLTQTAILSHAGQSTNIYFNLTGMFLGFLSAIVGLYTIIRTKRIITGKTKPL